MLLEKKINYLTFKTGIFTIICIVLNILTYKKIILKLKLLEAYVNL